MKMKELRMKESGELKRMLQEDRDALRHLRFKSTAGELKNVRDVRKTRKRIARILTLLTQKQP